MPRLSLLAAALSLVMLASGANLRAIFGFLLGGLDGVTWPRLAAAAVPIALATLLLARRGRALAAFLLGDEGATHLGIDVRRYLRDTLRKLLAGEKDASSLWPIANALQAAGARHWSSVVSTSAVAAAAPVAMPVRELVTAPATAPEPGAEAPGGRGV
jgi:hypothetical protein